VTPNIDVVKRGTLIGFATKFGSKLGGILAWRNLSQSSVLPTTTTRVVSIPQMVFTNSITTSHVNMIADWPLMSSMVVGRYINIDVVHPRRGYWKPFAIIAPILDHKDGHYVKLNMVTLKYRNLKKNVDPNVHVRVFNSIIKANAKTFEEYIINAFSYTLRNTTFGAIITFQNFLTIFFRSLHKHFANIIERFRMMSKYTWSWRTWSKKRLRGWRFTMSKFRSWLMVYKYQPHTIF
jgi:hypothetical protein